MGELTNDNAIIILKNGVNIKLYDTNDPKNIVIRVGKRPRGIAITHDGKKVFVANQEDNTLSVINTSTNKVMCSDIFIGQAPLYIYMLKNTSRAYVSCVSSQEISVINTETNNVIKASINVDSDPFQIVGIPDGRRIYAICDGVGKGSTYFVRIINTAINRVFNEKIQLKNLCIASVASPKGDKIYVAERLGTTLYIISTQTNKIISCQDLQISIFSMNISPDGTKLYLGEDLGGGNIYVFNTTTNTIITKVNITSPGDQIGGIAVSKDGRTVYATAVRNNKVVAINAIANKVIEPAISVGNGPEQIVLSPDGKYGYITNSLDNTVSVIYLV